MHIYEKGHTDSQATQRIIECIIILYSYTIFLLTFMVLAVSNILDGSTRTACAT